MDIVFYHTGCPKCKILEKKLNEKHLEYSECKDVDKMVVMGITSVPVLSVDGNIYNFTDAFRWVEEQ